MLLVPIAFVATPVVAGAAVGLSIKEHVAWYETLPRPSWAPPKQAFAPVWTLLYASMGLSAYFAFKAGAPPSAMILFTAQLLLNLAWAPIFFRLKNPKMALVEITVLIAALASTILAFWHVSKPAGALLIPYAAWVMYAAALNGAVVYKM